MKTWLKLLLTGVALILVFSGGVDFGLTTIPGIALLGFVWGFNPQLGSSALLVVGGICAVAYFLYEKSQNTSTT